MVSRADRAHTGQDTSPVRAIAWMVAALASFAVMAVSVRELSGEMHAFQMLFIRSVIGVFILLPILGLHARGWRQIRVTHLPAHALRNVIHFIGQVLWIIGIGLLPLATVSAVEFTSPLWGGVLAVLFLGERLNRGRITAFALGFIGILIVLRPGLIELSEGAVVMLFCALFFGGTNVVTKWLTRHESTLAVIFFMVVMQAVFGAIASTLVWQPVSWESVPWLALLAVTGLSAHYCLTTALTKADATFVMPLEFLRLPLVAVVGYLLYDESFELLILLGALIIFSGNYASLRYETRVRAKQ